MLLLDSQVPIPSEGTLESFCRPQRRDGKDAGKCRGHRGVRFESSGSFGRQHADGVGSGEICARGVPWSNPLSWSVVYARGAFGFIQRDHSARALKGKLLDLVVAGISPRE